MASRNCLPLKKFVARVKMLHSRGKISRAKAVAMLRGRKASAIRRQSIAVYELKELDRERKKFMRKKRKTRKKRR